MSEPGGNITQRIGKEGKSYDVRGSTGAGPEITSFLLSRAATVGLPDDVSTIASWQNHAAVDACLDSMYLGLFGKTEDACCEESESLDSRKLHFERFVESIRGIWSTSI